MWVEREREFWSYHRKAFANAGIRLSRPRLASAAARELFVSVLDAKAMRERIRRLSLLKKIRDWQMRRVALEIGVGESPSSGVEDRDQPRPA